MVWLRRVVAISAYFMVTHRPARSGPESAVLLNGPARTAIRLVADNDHQLQEGVQHHRSARPLSSHRPIPRSSTLPAQISGSISGSGMPALWSAPLPAVSETAAVKRATVARFCSSSDQRQPVLQPEQQQDGWCPALSNLQADGTRFPAKCAQVESIKMNRPITLRKQVRLNPSQWVSSRPVTNCSTTAGAVQPVGQHHVARGYRYRLHVAAAVGHEHQCCRCRPAPRRPGYASLSSR